MGQVGAAEGWDIAVACDIRLGEAFRRFPDLHNTQIEIDPLAIKETLETLPGYKPQPAPLVVTVMHEESMHTTDAMGFFYATRNDKHTYIRQPDELRIGLSLGNLSRDTKQQDSDIMTTLQHIHLRAVSSSSNTLQIVSTIMSSAKEKNGEPITIDYQIGDIEQAARAGRRAARSLGCFIMPEKPYPKPGEEITTSPGSLLFTAVQLQETAVHELQHAIDRVNPTSADTWKQRKLLTRLFGWRILSMIPVYASTHAAYEKIENLAFESLAPAANTVSGIGGTILSICAASMFGNRIIQTRRVEENYYERSVWEQRAEMAEEKASTMPRILKVTKLPAHTETPVSIR